jgi:hypothetical protein
MADPITVNTSDYEMRAARAQYLGGLLGALDAKRPSAWVQYGYPEEITFEKLLSAYERGGAGHGAVHRLLGKCWEQNPRIKTPDADDESAWEKKAAKVLKAVQAFKKLRDFDRRNMVGRFAGLIYRVADSQTLDQPLTKASKLVDLVPVFENQLKVTKWVDDQRAENFGDPAMYQYRSRPPQTLDTQAQPEQWVDVHPSRVQIFAEGSVGNMFDGVPLLRAGFNALVDLEKITGGSAESFLKNSARTVVFEYDPQSQPQAIKAADGSTTKSVREVHSEQTRELNRNQDSAIVLQGGKANTLQTTISDPTGPFETAANVFACSVEIPFTILFGQQTGRLASDQDQRDFTSRCKGRQQFELTPMLEEFVTRMQECGVIDAGEFEIEWPDLGAPTDEQRLTNAKTMADVAKVCFDAGMTLPPFKEQEIRKAAGYEEYPAAEVKKMEDEAKATEEEERKALEEQMAADAKIAAKGAAKKPAVKA